MGASLLAIAEVSALAGAMRLPLAVRRRPDRLSVVLGVIVTVIGIGAFTANGATPRILMVWNFGLSGVLPGPAYAIALGAVTTALVAAWRAGERERWAALVLLACAGVGLHSTY